MTDDWGARRGQTPRRMPPRISGSTVVIALLLLLAGCLPSSCRRTESTALLPADSLSRQIAASAMVDTLRLEWSTADSSPTELEYPRTVRFAGGDSVLVADAERSSLFVVADGFVIDEIPLPGIDVPFIAGVEGRTITLFDAGTLTFYRIRGGRAVDSTSIDDPGRERTSLVYGAARAKLYYKRVDPEKRSFIAAYSNEGQPLDTTYLDGPHWRYAGLLKMWGDTLVSLSGFRPVVDLLYAADGVGGNESTSTDTLALVGFDSPMLARSRLFMRGEVHEAPLLSSSAAPAGGLLFVLNIRAGWLQVDVFGRDGRLQHRLVGPDVEYRKAFFPQDLDVRPRGSGYEIAVVFTEPEPAVRLYRWTPGLPVD